MDQSLVHTFFSGEIRMDQWRSKCSESFGLDRYWSIECSSLKIRRKGFNHFTHKYLLSLTPKVGGIFTRVGLTGNSFMFPHVFSGPALRATER